jgi:hypothetical protein
MVWVSDEEASGIRAAYLEITSGIVQVEDPRLGKLPQGWRIFDHIRKHKYSLLLNEQTREIVDGDPRLNPEALAECGVDVQYFELI